MKKLFSIVMLAGMILSASCSHDRIDEVSEKGTFPEESYTVPEEEALAELQHMLQGMQTRGQTRTVANVERLHSSELIGTRGATGEDAPLAYIVNFEAGGYAVLGADRRQKSVLAIVNEDSMTAEKLVAAKQASDAGEKVDATTFANAMITDYLVRSLAENTPQPRIGWTIKEHKLPMMLTKWDWKRYNFEPGCIAICQLLVYNGKFNRVCPGQFMGYLISNWNALKAAATTPQPALDYSGYVDRLLEAVNYTLLSSDTPTMTIDKIVTKMKRSCPNEYKMLHTNYVTPGYMVSEATSRIRDRIWENNMPVYMEGTLPAEGYQAWVMDGWMMREILPGTNRQYLVYCNFGQNGHGDGLYLVDTFDACENLGYIYYTFD